MNNSIEVILCQPNEISKIDINEYKDWVYLGYSYRELIKLENFLGTSRNMKLFHERISKKAKELRNDFLADFSQISRANHSIYWHISETAENNSMTNNLFLDFCYFHICKDILKQQNESILIIIQNRALLELLHAELKSRKHMNIKFIRGKSALLKAPNKIIQLCRSNLSFIFQFLLRKLIIKFYWKNRRKKYQLSNTNILAYTFANDTCFHESGIYKQRYFGQLVEKLEDKGMYIIYFLHATGYSIKKYIDVVKWINKSKNSFVLLEEQVTIGNVFLSLFTSFDFLKTRIPKSSINDDALCFLIEKAIAHEGFSGSLHIYYLYYTFINNISARKQLKFSFVLDIYEGHIIERILRYSIKKKMPECKTIGFSHSTFSSNHLSFFSSLTALGISLKPDYLLCTGKAFKKVFLKHGFKENTIHLVGNLREEFLDTWKYNPNMSEKRNTILVALPLLLLDAQELTMKIIKAFKNSDLQINIYKHPMMSIESLGINESDLPQNIEFKSEPTFVGMKKCNLLITTGSNMSVVALKIGLPVISVIRTVGLSFEPLDWFNSPITYCSTPDEINSNSNRLLSLSKVDYNQYAEDAITIATECLEPINNGEIERFLKQLRN
jgi:hypothetical protein